MQFLLADSCHMCMLQSCRHGSSTIYLTGVHANPVLEPTSTVFQQAADVGMSHCTLLRHVLSRACVRAGLPPIPPPIVQDVTETNLVCQDSCAAYLHSDGLGNRVVGVFFGPPSLPLCPLGFPGDAQESCMALGTYMIGCLCKTMLCLYLLIDDNKALSTSEPSLCAQS